jgi:hypothetical protein
MAVDLMGSEERFRIPPLVDLVEHGERGPDIDPDYPDACLCGRYADYLACPDAFQLGRMTIGVHK